ncbi:alanine racemase [Allosphingosinicella deserti]|uniref:Alanine racemase n=1 Tax=Allosphingosinicella deserti TaxID=2116704 RepID=A0A2P7QLZ7_9SPHN|nr:alanine racemase [Sphingomonas deserti]PSJ38993.1 alanine racemase [Sphingomonas deserti]
MQHQDAGGGARLTIDLEAIRANYRALAAVVAPAPVGAVIKADAYGLGAARVAPSLAEAGCRTFFVAMLDEALALQPLLPADARLYVLNGLAPGTEAECAAAGIAPVLNSLAQVRRWQDVVAQRREPVAAALQIDTGMSRLGLSAGEADVAAREMAGAAGMGIDLVMSHLACADDPADPSNQRQLEAFRRLSALFPNARLSLANSGGALLDARFHFALVRAGIALYGAPPISAAGVTIALTVQLSAPIIQVRTIAAGDGLGYGLTGGADHERQVAILGIGYADGWPRQLGNTGAAYHRRVRLPIVGRVSMDSLAVDVTMLAEEVLCEGLHLELIGPNQSLDQVARDAGTIPYEILTRLGRRFSRTWVN